MSRLALPARTKATVNPGLGHHRFQYIRLHEDRKRVSVIELQYNKAYPGWRVGKVSVMVVPMRRGAAGESQSA